MQLQVSKPKTPPTCESVSADSLLAVLTELALDLRWCWNPVSDLRKAERQPTREQVILTLRDHADRGDESSERVAGANICSRTRKKPGNQQEVSANICRHFA